jgi:hypothetical protein
VDKVQKKECERIKVLPARCCPRKISLPNKYYRGCLMVCIDTVVLGGEYNCTFYYDLWDLGFLQGLKAEGKGLN